jgi:outer membrane protein assembly factor BamA
VAWLQLGTELGYMTPDIGEGTDSNYPSIEQIFSDADASGLLEQPSYLHTTFFAEVDYRDERGRPRSGGFYEVAMGFWNDRTLELYDFKRFDATFSQYVPLDSGKKHVLLGRFGVSYVNNETGSRVPFYFLPYIGGVDTIRAFHEFRFRDENALWMTAEYNWTLMKWVSLATFIDAGKVAPDWQDIRASGLKHGYGFGARVHSNRQTFARVDVGAGGGEGWRVFLKLGPGF